MEYSKQVLEISFYSISILGVIFAFFKFILSDKKQKAMEAFIKFHKIIGEIEDIQFKFTIENLDEESKWNIRENLTEIETIATIYNTFCFVSPISKRIFKLQFSKKYHQPIIDYLTKYIIAEKGVLGYKSFFDQTMKMFKSLSLLKKI